MFTCRNVKSLCGVNCNIIFKSDSAENINLQRDVIFVESYDTVSDSNYVSFLDKGGVVSFEEGFGWGSLIGDDTVDFGYLSSLASFNEGVLCWYYLGIDVVSVTEVLKLLDFDEGWLG